MIDNISLKLPAKGEYTTSLRLFFAGLTSRLFDVEKVEDVKLIAVEFLNMAIREEKEYLDLSISILDGKLEISCPVKFDEEDDLSYKIMESLCNFVKEERDFVIAGFEKE